MDRYEASRRDIRQFGIEQDARYIAGAIAEQLAWIHATERPTRACTPDAASLRSRRW